MNINEDIKRGCRKEEKLVPDLIGTRKYDEKDV